MKKNILGLVLIFCFQATFAADDVFVYFLKYTGRFGKDVVVYCGITKDPESRALEHAQGGTMGYNTFDTMVVFAGPMSRSQAYKEETKCIETNRIPKMYQTYPRNERGIEKYESRFDTSRLEQIPNPRVEYTPEVIRVLEQLGLLEPEPVCEACGASVTDGVIDYSQQHFDGRVFCRSCQSRQQSHSHNVRATHAAYPDASQLVYTAGPSAPVCEDCDAHVTRGVLGYSRNHFHGHVFCMDCQSYH
jgi:predicted GIY-YIG superfamily endonuclease